ncbi:phospholipid phosphatase 1-like, partial [Ruditapes philippinarum]|uniref:phospholipid phosphatase 1-like n=1 Tax=Ruditapes philippinarum TaxID=129788 RepID=UPI00295B170C
YRDQDTEGQRSRTCAEKLCCVFTVYLVEVTLWLLLLVSALILAFNIIDVEPLWKRGFFCNDETIQYPYKDDTVSKTLVAIIFVVVPIGVVSMTVPGTNQYKAMRVKFLGHGNNGLPLAGFKPTRPAIVRLLVRRFNHRAMPPLNNNIEVYVWIIFFQMFIIETFHFISSITRQTDGKKILAQKLLVKLYRTIGAFLFAATCTLILTETMKIFGGRLRPHFICLCKPDFSKINCSHGYIMIQTDVCTSDVTKKKLSDARKSFPSGHASLSTFGAIYLLAFLQLRCTCTKKVRTLLPLIQLGILCAAIYVCISRVNDNKHHFSDVIAGAILGTVIALLSLKYVSCLRKDVSQENHYLQEQSLDRSSDPILINLT